MSPYTAKKSSSIMVLFTITYMISYITRINFGAILTELESATGFSRTLLSVSITGSFVTYGLGQILSGILGDKFHPKTMVRNGLVITTLMNCLIPFCKSPYTMAIFWCCNGFAQSMMWPPLVRYMTALFSAEEYKVASTRVNWGASFGTIIVYFAAPFLIGWFGYTGVFFTSAGLGLAMTLLWVVAAPDFSPATPKKKQEQTATKTGRLFPCFMILILLAILCQGMLRDGVTTWMPTYIADTYSLENGVAILTGVILPLFSIGSLWLSGKLYQTKCQNPVTCGAIFFGVGGLSALSLFFFTGKAAALSVLFSALLTGCMHGVNLMLVCMVPAFFKNSGKVSTVSGIINACTYVGSALSTYGIALISQTKGWNTTILVWTGIALLGTVLCLIALPAAKKQWQT